MSETSNTPIKYDNLGTVQTTHNDEDDEFISTKSRNENRFKRSEGASFVRAHTIGDGFSKIVNLAETSQGSKFRSIMKKHKAEIQEMGQQLDKKTLSFRNPNKEESPASRVSSRHHFEDREEAKFDTGALKRKTSTNFTKGAPNKQYKKEASIALNAFNDLPINMEQMNMLQDKVIQKSSADMKKMAKVPESALAQPTRTFNPDFLRLQRLPPKVSIAGKKFERRKADTGLFDDFKVSDLVISPHSKGKIIWDCVSMFIILYEMLTIPFFLSFTVNAGSSLAILEFLVSLFFMADLAMSFNTGYYEKGILILNRAKIIRQYMKAWFWIDAASTFPYDWLAGNPLDFSGDTEGSSATDLIKILRIIRFARIVRLLRVLKLKKIMQKIEFYLSISTAVNVLLGFLKLGVIILVVAHWIACFWHYLALGEADSQYLIWLSAIGIYDAPWQFRYLTSIYWATTTMITIGYGDITPTTKGEKLFAISVMLFACAVFAFVMNKINELLADLDSKSATYKARLVSIMTYLVKKKVNHELKMRIKQFAEFMLQVNSSYNIDQGELLGMLSENLKHELIIQLNLKQLKMCKVLTENFSIRFVEQCSYILHEKNYTVDDLIFNEEEQDDCALYILKSGMVEFLALKTYTHLKEMDKGVFGEIAFITGGKRTATARAAEFCRIFRIKREDFLHILKNFPHELERFAMMRDNMCIYGQYGDIRLLCWGCHKPGHPITACPALHYEAERRIIIKKHQQRTAKRQVRFDKFCKEFQRSKRPKIHPLWDYKTLEDRAILARDKIGEEIFDAYEHAFDIPWKKEDPLFGSVVSEAEKGHHRNRSSIGEHIRISLAESTSSKKSNLEILKASSNKQSVNELQSPLYPNTQMLSSDNLKGSQSESIKRTQTQVEVSMKNSRSEGMKRTQTQIEASPKFDDPMSKLSVNGSDDAEDEALDLFQTKRDNYDHLFTDYCEIQSYKVYYPHNNVENVLIDFQQVNENMIYRNDNSDDDDDDENFEEEEPTPTGKPPTKKNKYDALPATQELTEDEEDIPDKQSENGTENYLSPREEATEIQIPNIPHSRTVIIKNEDQKAIQAPEIEILSPQSEDNNLISSKNAFNLEEESLNFVLGTDPDQSPVPENNLRIGSYKMEALDKITEFKSDAKENPSEKTGENMFSPTAQTGSNPANSRSKSVSFKSSSHSQAHSEKEYTAILNKLISEKGVDYVKLALSKR
jgi:hyperpolarization activated cyclic nucleotide-gated potassium channel 2